MCQGAALCLALVLLYHPCSSENQSVVIGQHFFNLQVKLDPGGFFGLSAATGDLADNHDVVSFKVSDPTEMSEEETRDLAQRIEMDVDRGVENEVHHDPQYENQQQEVGKPLPLWISLSAIGLVVVVIAGLVYMSQRSQTHHAKHFT